MPKPLSLSFDLPFEEAIAAATARKVVLPDEYYGATQAAMRRAATTVSGLAGIDQVQAVIDSLVDALGKGQAFGDWQRMAELRDWRLPKGRLETIFRTSVQTAYSAGHWKAFEENRATQPYLMWSAINDSRVRPTHLAMDGYIAPINDPIWRKWHAPAGYNSLLPWQRVSGNAYVGLKARYSGPIVEIRGQTGAQLSVTAQHPILTRRGWVAAQDVEVGDQLVAYRAPVRSGSVPTDLHEDDAPPTIEQVFDALALRARGAMPRSALHLHGDAKFLHGDVEIVGADRKLIDRMQATRAQSIDHFLFALAHNAAALAARARALFVIAWGEQRQLACASGALDTGRRRSPNYHSDTASFQITGQALAIDSESRRKVAQGRAISVETANHIRNRFAEMRGGTTHFAARQEGGNFRFGPLGNTRFADVFIGGFEVNPNALADALQAHPGLVEFEDVVDLRLSNWTGHVYDLETASGNILAYGNVGQRHFVVSNCRCSQVSLTEKQAIARGYGRQTRPQVEPDAGFGGNVAPGDLEATIAEAEANKLQQLDPRLAHAYWQNLPG